MIRRMILPTTRLVRVECLRVHRQCLVSLEPTTFRPTRRWLATSNSAARNNDRKQQQQQQQQQVTSKISVESDAVVVTDRIQCNTLIDTWMKRDEPPERAEDLLETMRTMARQKEDVNLLPNVDSYNLVLRAWAKSKDPVAAERAEAILQTMLDMDSSGFPNVAPDILTYTTALYCVAKTKTRKAAGRAKEILDGMLHHVIAGDEDLMPTTLTFNIVINAFAKCRNRESAMIAEAIFAQMKSLDVQPNTQSFISLISAWTSSRDPQAVTKAEDYLSEMIQLYENGEKTCKPDIVVFTAVIHAISMSKDPKAAERVRAILNEMTRLESVGLLHGCRPNVIMYNSLLNLLAKRKTKDRSVVTRKVITEMDERFLLPNISSYDFVILSCAFSNNYDLETREAAFKIALEMVQRACRKTTPTVQTFFYFFRAAAGLGHDNEVQLVYKLCRQAGVEQDPLIVRELKESAPHLVDKF